MARVDAVHVNVTVRLLTVTVGALPAPTVVAAARVVPVALTSQAAQATARLSTRAGTVSTRTVLLRPLRIPVPVRHDGTSPSVLTSAVVDAA